MTKKQKKILDAYLRVGSKTGAANELNLARSYVRKTIAILEQRGEVPWNTAAPRPDHLNYGKSTVQLNAEGQVIQEWRRQSPQAEGMQGFVDALCDQARGKGKVKKRKARKTDTSDTLFELDIFDAHVGMYADEKETLDTNYDCDIAAQRMIEAVEDLASKANRPQKAVLVFGGDMMHSDNQIGRAHV